MVVAQIKDLELLETVKDRQGDNEAIIGEVKRTKREVKFPREELI